MHCVSIYPTPDEDCQLNQIDLLRARYPSKIIGWSTHENPDDTLPIAIAFSKGARMFERHVGIETDQINLNHYSSTPEQLDKWIKSYKKTKLICGSKLRSINDIETKSLDTLRRGVCKKRI